MLESTELPTFLSNTFPTTHRPPESEFGDGRGLGGEGGKQKGLQRKAQPNPGPHRGSPTQTSSTEGQPHPAQPCPGTAQPSSAPPRDSLTQRSWACRSILFPPVHVVNRLSHPFHDLHRLAAISLMPLMPHIALLCPSRQESREMAGASIMTLLQRNAPKKAPPASLLVSHSARLFVGLGPHLPLAVFLLRLPHLRARLSSQP